jgi:hypothetical protein
MQAMDVDSNDRFQGASWAFRLMAGFLVLLCLVAWSVWLSQANRTGDERISEPTAVADEITLEPDPRDKPGKEVLRWKGQPYFLQTNELARIWDSEVLKAGKDDSGKVELYQAKKQNDPRVFLVKITPNAFLRLTPR